MTPLLFFRKTRPRALRIACNIVLLLAVSPLLLCQTNLSFESRISPRGDGEATLTNRSNIPVVAWIFEILREPCNPIEADRHVYAGYDSASAPDGAILGPLESRAQEIGSSHCNKAGTSSPNKASLKVVLFADGSSVGDSYWLDILRRDRRVRLKRIGHAVQVLKEMNGTQKREQCVALLNKTRAALPPGEEPQVQYSTPDPFDMAIRELTQNRSTPLNDQIAGLLVQLQAERGHVESQQ